MLQRLVWTAGLIALGMAAAPDARAEMVTWTVQGSVSMFTGATQALPFDIAAGQQFTLTITFDDAMPQLGSSAVSAGYGGGFVEASLQFANGSVPLTFGPTSAASFGVTDNAFDFTPSGITRTDAFTFSLPGATVNNYNRRLGFSASRTQSTAPGTINGLEFITGAEAQAMIAAPSTTAFFFNTDIAGRYYAEVRGALTSISVSPLAAVPLPGAAWLFSLGLLGLSRVRRRD